jgi:hypothetical protein
MVLAGFVVVGFPAHAGTTPIVSLPAASASSSDQCAQMDFYYPDHCVEILNPMTGQAILYLYALTGNFCMPSQLGGQNGIGPSDAPTMGIYEESNNNPGLQTTSGSGVPDSAILATCAPWVPGE